MLISNKIKDVIYLNQLWHKIFPYLSRYIKDLYGKDHGCILEYGIFSGGISIELAKLSKDYDIFISGLESEALKAYTRNWITASIPAANITIKGSLFDLEDAQFDLIICRGFFFYLDNEEIFPDILRLLKPGGVAILGGGYGDHTPQAFIDEIADESKILNDRLGRKWFDKEKLVKILESNNLNNISEIIDKGGIWIRIRKNGFYPKVLL